MTAYQLRLVPLRQVDRYGVSTAGQQYRGFRQLGAGEASGTGTEGFSSVEDAARFLIRHGLGDDRQDSTPTVPDVREVIGNQALLGRLYRQEARRLQPRRRRRREPVQAAQRGAGHGCRCTVRAAAGFVHRGGHGCGVVSLHEPARRPSPTTPGLSLRRISGRPARLQGMGRRSLIRRPDSSLTIRSVSPPA